MRVLAHRPAARLIEVGARARRNESPSHRMLFVEATAIPSSYILRADNHGRQLWTA